LTSFHSPEGRPRMADLVALVLISSEQIIWIALTEVDPSCSTVRTFNPVTKRLLGQVVLIPVIKIIYAKYMYIHNFRLIVLKFVYTPIIPMCQS
jgi:hypothetical protein